MANKTQTARVTVTMDTQQAERQLQVLNDKAGELKTEINSLKALKLQNIATPEDLSRLRELGQAYRQVRKDAKELKDQLGDVRGVIDNISSAPIKAIRDALKKATAQMERMDRSTKAFADKKKEVELLRQELDKINNVGGKTNDVFDGIGKTIKRLASYVLVYFGFNELTAGLRRMYEMNIKLSDQLADIEKTTGLAGKELRALSDDIIRINTRTSVEELNKLAIAAGKIGINSRKDVLAFVEAGNQIQVALGEDLGEDAIKNIAKLNEVLGVTANLGVEKSLLATGSAINELGQNSTASEGYLVDFSQRMGGIAAQAKLTMPQLLALGSVTDQLGQNVEVSATALNKFVTELVSNTSKVASAIGVPLQELKKQLDQSTWQGLVFVMEKLNGKGGLAGLAPIMKDLGSDGARLTAVLSALASNYKMLSSEVELSNKAFTEATSVTDETMKKENSLAGVVEKIWKNITQSVANSQFVDKINEIAVYIEQATSSFDEFGNKISGATNIIVTLIGYLVKLGNVLVQNIDWIARLVFAFSSVRIAISAANIATKTYTALTSSMIAVQITATTVGKAFAIAFYTLIGNTKKASAAMATFNALTKANPWILAGTALVALGTAIYGIVRAAGQASREMKALQNSINSNVAAEQAQASFLFEAAMKAKAGTDERRKAIEELNRKYGEYIPFLREEVTSTSDLKEALDKVNEALKEKIVMQMKQKDVESITTAGITAQLSEINNITKSSSATEEMTNKMIMRAKELTETYSSMGAGATETFLTVRKALEREFGSVAAQSKDFWSAINGYVLQSIKLRDDLNANEKKYATFLPKTQKSDAINQIPEVVVSGVNKSRADAIPETDKERKKRLKESLDAIDAYIDQEKTKLIQSRINREKYRNEEIRSESKYNEMLEKIEFEGLEKKLAVAGLDNDKRAEIERQFYDLKLRFFNKAEQDTKQYLSQLDKLYDQFELKGATRDQRELIRIQQKYNDATALLKAALDKQLISQEEYEKQIKDLKEKEEQAEKQYFKDLQSKEAMREVREINEQQSRAELEASEMRLNGILTEQEYKAALYAIEEMYQSKRLQVAGLTEEQLTELKRKNADRQIAILDNASRRQEQIQKQYETMISTSLTNVGSAFGDLIAGEEDAMQSFGNTMVDVMFDVLDQMVDIWIMQMTGTAVSSTANAKMNSMSTLDSAMTGGVSGAIKGALLAGIIGGILAVAKSAIKSAIKGGKGNPSSSGQTGQRVIKSGYSVGGDTGDGPVTEIAGVVHRKEYVVPAWQMKDPVSFNYVRALETIRQTRSHENKLKIRFMGYETGGPVQTSIPLVPMGTDPEMKAMLKEMGTLLNYLKSNPFRIDFSVAKLKETQTRMENSRLRGSLKK